MDLRAEAEHYCALVERAQELDREELMAQLAPALAGLLEAAYRLAEVGLDEAEQDRDMTRPSQEDYQELFGRIQRTLGSWDLYWLTFEPIGEGQQQAIANSLSDDLADIWRDLKEGLLGLAEGMPETDVLWEWRFGFYSHWGRHAVEALRVVHARLAEVGGPPRPSP